MFIPFLHRLTRRNTYSDGILLCHGNMVNYFTKTDSSTIRLDDDHLQSLPDKLPFQALLAAPFVYVYAHKTIQLRRKDLINVDRQTIPRFRFENTPGVIESIRVETDKAITIHSVLTKEGQDLIRKLRKLQRRIKWKSAMAEFVKSTINSTKTADSNQFYRFYFNQEALQIEKRVNTFNVHHATYPLQESHPSKKINLINDLFGNSTVNGKTRFIDLNTLNETDDPISEELNKLLLFKIKNPKQQFIRANIKTKSRKSVFRKRPRANSVLGFILVTVALMAALMSYNENRSRSVHQEWKEKVERMEASTSSFTEISKVEEAYFKLTSLVRAIESLKTRPGKTLKSLETNLPDQVWIHTVSFSQDKMDLYLLSEKAFDIPTLLSVLNKQFGESILLENKKTQFDKLTINTATFQTKWRDDK